MSHISVASRERTCDPIIGGEQGNHRIDLTDMVKMRGEKAKHEALARMVQAYGNSVDLQVLARFVISQCKNTEAAAAQSSDDDCSDFRGAVQKICRGNEAISRDRLHALIRSCPADPYALRFLFVNTPYKNADGSRLINPFFYSAFIRPVKDPALFKISQAAFKWAQLDGKCNSAIRGFYNQACQVNDQPVEELRLSPGAMEEDPADEVVSINFSELENLSDKKLACLIVDRCSHVGETLQKISAEDIKAWGFRRGAQEILSSNVAIARNVLHALIRSCDDPAALRIFLESTPDETFDGQSLRNAYFYRMFMKSKRDAELFEVAKDAFRMAENSLRHMVADLRAAYKKACHANGN